MNNQLVKSHKDDKTKKVYNVITLKGIFRENLFIKKGEKYAKYCINKN